MNFFKKRNRKKEEKRVGAAVLSLLSGNPDAEDKQHHHIRTLVDNARYELSIQAFSIECQKVQTGKKPYQTMWTKSPHGVYVFVRTEVPINIKGDIKTTPGYAVLFSQHPSFLSKLLLQRNLENFPSLNEIESKVSIVSARYHHDILHTNKKTGEEHLVTSWVKDSIDRHTKTFTRLLKRHGSVIQDGENIFRNGSTVLWMEPTEEFPDKYECYYYGNPVVGQTSLFMNERTLESPLSNYFLKKSAIKLDTPPLSKEDAHDFMHREFSKIARSVIRNEDPYDLNKPIYLSDKVGFFFQKTVLRTFQKMAHSIANMNKRLLLLLRGSVEF